jgi:UDP-N-acetyl-D-mannosaminuronic acid dehydrogenase
MFMKSKILAPKKPLVRKICVLGLGYIGLPTALLLAQKYPVIGVDINEKIITTLNDSNLPFVEKELDNLFQKVRGNFTATTTVKPADAFIIAVPTPLEESLKIADLQYVRRAAEMIAPILKRGNLVILESTVPPGISENVVLSILEKSGLSRSDFLFVHCPERAIPGNTLFEMINNDRIIGGINENSSNAAKNVYASFVKGRLLITDTKTAEFVKLMENTSRDVNIALANEFAKIASEIHIDVWEAIDLANRHPRVKILQPGPGVGGHCIAIDPWFLTETSTQSQMISLARTINDSMPNYVLNKVRNILRGVSNPVITLFGVSYKKNVDDWRATPTLRLMRLIQSEGWIVRLHDPFVRNFPYAIQNLNESVLGTDCIIIMTDHDIFQEINPSELRVRTKNIVDTRNSLKKEKWKNEGFAVYTLGDGTSFHSG